MQWIEQVDGLRFLYFLKVNINETLSHPFLRFFELFFGVVKKAIEIHSFIFLWPWNVESI